ncbi:MAG: substrate-binding domain-containing protein, partial [Pseudomonadota bacterium]
IQDLQRREADIAIRHVRPDQPELIARLIGHAPGSFYAHQSYLDRNGTPRTLKQLSTCEFIGMPDIHRMIEYFAALNIHVTQDQFKSRSANGMVAWEMAKTGLGVLPMSDIVAQDCPGMIKLLPDLDTIAFPFWLTTHRELHTSARIRLVFDHLADALKQHVMPA